MAEYIERENAIAWFMPYAHVGESIDADVVISDIKGMKAADVAQVRWQPVFGYEGKRKTVKGLIWNYCPNCGAKMESDK